MKFAILLIIFTVGFISQLKAQEVEHNFEMKPQKTNCEEINLDNLSEEQQISIVENGIYRFTQDFKLNRREGFQAAWYYSCDNKTGVVIAKIDNKKHLYRNINMETWEKFTASADFISFIDNHFISNK